MNNINNLNQEIASLIDQLGNLIAIKRPDLMEGMQAVLALAQTKQAEVELTNEELATSDDLETFDTLGEELDIFTRKLRLAYAYKYGETPDWLKSGQKTDRDYYANFFENVGSLDTEFVSFFEADNSLTFAEKQTKYEEWLTLADAKAAKSAAAAKAHKALDLKALLIGALRMYGKSNFEIRASLLA